MLYLLLGQAMFLEISCKGNHLINIEKPENKFYVYFLFKNYPRFVNNFYFLLIKRTTSNVSINKTIKYGMKKNKVAGILFSISA